MQSNIEQRISGTDRRETLTAAEIAISFSRKNSFAVQKDLSRQFKLPDKTALQNLGLLKEKSDDTNHGNFDLFGRGSNL